MWMMGLSRTACRNGVGVRFGVALIILVCFPLCAMGADGRRQLTFSVDAPFPEVVRKMDTEQSLARVLLSQGIEILDYEVTDRGFSLKRRTLDARIRIKGRVPRFSRSPAAIEQTVQLGPEHAKLEFVLLEPLEQLAEQHYIINFAAQDERTTITIAIYSRVFVQQRRLRCVRRLINRVAHRRVAEELQRAIVDLRQSISQVVSEDRPPDAKSILLF
jgi:hypothetical protein